MGSSQSKTTKIKYFDGSEYSGQVNEKGQEHGRGKIQYANKNVLEGKFYEGDCVKAQIKYNNGNQYQGELQRLLFHGQGKLKTPQSTMEGLFREGKFMYGKVAHKDWNYQGSVVNMKKNGFGTLHFINQRIIYEGYFKDDLFQGTGELESTDEWYEGQFKNGKYDGVGVLKGLKDGEPLFMYEGQFKRGKIEGQGKIKYSNHDIYEGEFFSGLKNGRGTYKYHNGDVYIGKFAHDLKNDSNCQIHSRDSTLIYRGGIKDGKYHGKGTMTNSENRTKYEGQFSQGFKNGKGILTTPDYLYDGEFKDDLKEGFGRINFNSGEVFEGWFLNGMKNGKGKSITNKQTTLANYVDDIKNGPYEIISTKEYEYFQKGTFLNGKRHGNIYIKKGGHQRTILFDNGIQQDEDSEL